MPHDDIKEEEQRTLIERALSTWGYTAERWDVDPDDDRLRAFIGMAEVIDEDDENGLYADDTGMLYACVVGGHEFGNVHVAFYFQPEGMEGGLRVEPGTTVELI